MIGNFLWPMDILNEFLTYLRVLCAFAVKPLYAKSKFVVNVATESSTWNRGCFLGASFGELLEDCGHGVGDGDFDRFGGGAPLEFDQPFL